MKRFVHDECRTQSTLLPELLNDYTSENTPVRVVAVFVDELDLGKLGFEGIVACLPVHTVELHLRAESAFCLFLRFPENA